MKTKDLRSQIIPTKISNTDENQEKGNKKFDTKDFIYLDSYEEQFNRKYTDEDRRVSATDYAKMNHVYLSNNYQTKTGKNTAPLWLRSALSSYNVYYVLGAGVWSNSCTSDSYLGLCPSLHFNLPSNISARSASRFFKHGQKQTEEEEYEFDIREVKDKWGKTIYHTLQIGEYIKTKEEEELSRTLEALYHGGNLKEGLTATGRWYSGNGQKEDYKNYAGKHSPEFEYQGKKYARVIANPDSDSRNLEYSDGTLLGEEGTVRWTRVEPISFVIKNWEEMPKSINPRGNGKATYFDLRTEEAIIGNIPFYPDEDDNNSTMWQNSMVRGFFNGIDVRNIKENGNPEFGAERGGNFTGECNFLNEAFNGEREPIYEYAIPESETEIPDDAFNGCVTLKKLVIHPDITSIGKRAFSGLSFQYAYRLKTGELIFAQDLPKNREELDDIIQLENLAKPLVGFDYNILVQNDKLKEIANLSEKLNKCKFSIPYIYRTRTS